MALSFCFLHCFSGGRALYKSTGRLPFGSCLRLDDLDGFFRECQKAGIPETTVGWPRLEPPRHEASGLRIGALLDPDASLLRLIQNRDT